MHHKKQRQNSCNNVSPRDMICLGNMCMDTQHKGVDDDDDDDYNDDNNNNNNNNNVIIILAFFIIKLSIVLA